MKDNLEGEGALLVLEYEGLDPPAIDQEQAHTGLLPLRVLPQVA